MTEAEEKNQTQDFEERVLHAAVLLRKAVVSDWEIQREWNHLVIYDEMEIYLRLRRKFGEDREGNYLVIKDKRGGGNIEHKFDPKFLLIGILCGQLKETELGEWALFFYQKEEGQINKETVEKVQASPARVIEIFVRCGKSLGLNPQKLLGLLGGFQVQGGLDEESKKFHLRLREGLENRIRTKGVSGTEEEQARLKDQVALLERENERLKKELERILSERNEDMNFPLPDWLSKSEGEKISGENGIIDLDTLRVLLDGLSKEEQFDLLERLKKGILTALHPDRVPRESTGWGLLDERLKNTLVQLEELEKEKRIH